LNRGELLQDGKDYYNDHVKPGATGCDINHFCFFDNVNDFYNSAVYPNKEPWLMLSEVEFTAAVPEPSTWMMLIAGFAGIGFLSYRRRRQTLQLA
jgi:hypothetical protein